MKKLFFVIFFMTVNYAMSQKSISGKITYEIKFANLTSLQKDLNKILYKNNKLKIGLRDKMKKTILNSRNINGILNFLFYESLYSSDSNLDNEGEKGINLIKITAGKGFFYTNMKTKETLKVTNDFGKKYLINMTPLNWKFFSKTKKIGQYNCYKATTSIVIEGRWNKSVKPITAWFTTEIPVSFGPKNYNGLPGLVLELYEGKLLYKATKIELNSTKSTPIVRPTKGIKVTENEYIKNIKKMLKKMGF